jgi:hypothetical protein
MGYPRSPIGTIGQARLIALITYLVDLVYIANVFRLSIKPIWTGCLYSLYGPAVYIAYMVRLSIWIWWSNCPDGPLVRMSRSPARFLQSKNDFNV